MDSEQNDDLEIVINENGDGMSEVDEGEFQDVALEEFYDEEDAEFEETNNVVSGPDTSIRQFNLHTGPVYALSVTSDGKKVLTGGGDDVGHIFTFADMAPEAVLQGHTDSIVAVGISPDNSLGATGGYDGIIRIWDMNTGAFLFDLEGPSGEIEWLSWHPRGSVLVAGSADATVWMWSVDKRGADHTQFMHVFSGHDDAVSCGSFSNTGNTVITGSADSTVRVWNPKTGQCTAVFGGHDWCEGSITGISMAPEGPVICATSQDGSARLANVATGKVLLALQHDTTVIDEMTEEEQGIASVECSAFCPTQPWVVTGATDGTIKLWEISSGRERSSFTASGGIIKLKWLPGTALTLLATTARGTVEIWDLKTNNHTVFTGHKGMVYDAVRVGDEIITAGDDGFVRVYKL